MLHASADIHPTNRRDRHVPHALGTRSRLASLAIGAVAAAAVLAGCSDDASTAQTAVSTTAVVSTTAAVLETAPIESVLVDDSLVADPGVGSGPGAGTEFCAINGSLDAVASDAIDADGTPAALQQFFEVEFPEQFARMTAAAPADLVDDMAVLGAGFTSLGRLFADNGWDLEAAYNDPELNNVLDNQAYVDAGTAVDEYCAA